MKPELTPPLIRLEIGVDDANLILEALGKLPFVSVYQLIARIQQQAQAQVMGPAQQGGAAAGE